jgi:hypothetical protein
MKYFNYELIAAANDWIEQNESERQQAEARFWEAVRSYNLQLDRLKGRVSNAAWNFFRNGFGSTGLHDASLIDLQLSLARPKGTALIRFINYERIYQYDFHLIDISSTEIELSGRDLLNESRSLFTYELTEISDGSLQLGFVFADGGMLSFQFKRLVFCRIRIPK